MNLENNQAQFGSAFAITLSDDIILNKLKIRNNIAIRQDSTLQTSFQRNRASIFNVNKTFMGSNTPFFNSDDSIGTGRGTVYIHLSKNVKVTNSIFKNNVAKFGGCFYLSAVRGSLTSLFIENSYYVNNNVSSQGSVLYADEYSTFDVSSSSFISNKCRDWTCKLFFSKNWKEFQYSFFELLFFSRPTHDIIVLILQCIAVSIICLIIIDSTALAMMLIFKRFFSVAKHFKEKGSQSEDDNEEKSNELKPSEDNGGEMKQQNINENVEIEEVKESIETPENDVMEMTLTTENEAKNTENEMDVPLTAEIDVKNTEKEMKEVDQKNENNMNEDDFAEQLEKEENEIDKVEVQIVEGKKSFLKSSFASFKSRQDEQDSYYDTGILSTILGWLFSTVSFYFFIIQF